MPQRNESDGIGGGVVAAVVGRLRDEAREILLERRRSVVEDGGGIDVGKPSRDGMPELKDDRGEPLVDDEEVCLDLGEPSQDVIDYARRELGETDDVKCRTLQELRDMIYGNLGRKQSLNVTRDRFYSVRLEILQIFVCVFREGGVSAAQDGRRFFDQISENEELQRQPGASIGKLVLFFFITKLYSEFSFICNFKLSV